MTTKICLVGLDSGWGGGIVGGEVIVCGLGARKKPEATMIASGSGPGRRQKLPEQRVVLNLQHKERPNALVRLFSTKSKSGPSPLLIPEGGLAWKDLM